LVASRQRRNCSARTGRLSAVLLALTIELAPSSGQNKQAPVARVPFVGCRSDGQAGPVEAPDEAEKAVQVEPGIAQKLAYYKSAVTPGSLGPRGWYCLGEYGSGGSSILFIKPEPIAEATLAEITGPVIEIDSNSGDTSGRFEVARVIARVFPKHLAFVQSVIDLFDFFASEVAYGPYPTDKLVYRSDRVVEYITPPNSIGLGTTNFVKPNDEPIEGVAILQGPTPDLLLLSVRLPPDMYAIKSPVIRHLEYEASNQPYR